MQASDVCGNFDGEEKKEKETERKKKAKKDKTYIKR